MEWPFQLYKEPRREALVLPLPIFRPRLHRLPLSGQLSVSHRSGQTYLFAHSTLMTSTKSIPISFIIFTLAFQLGNQCRPPLPLSLLITTQIYRRASHHSEIHRQRTRSWAHCWPFQFGERGQVHQYACIFIANGPCQEGWQAGQMEDHPRFVVWQCVSPFCQQAH